MNVVGLGPLITPYQTLRAINKAQVRHICEVAGEDMAYFLNKSRLHALIIGVKRNTVNLTSLTTNLSQPLKLVTFSSQNKGKVVLFGGQHRIEATKVLLAKHIKEYQNLQSDRKGNQHDDNLLWEKEQTIRDTLLNFGTWAVCVYDMGEWM